jgi:hypothetical protein
MKEQSSWRNYLSLLLLLIPAILFSGVLYYGNERMIRSSVDFPFVAWELYVIGLSGTIATLGGILDWRYHRDPLKMKLSEKERDAEAFALGVGGVPMFIFMTLASFSENSHYYLIPIIVVLIYTVVAICYDEFVFHRKRCDKEETIYHRMLVFGNGIAWVAWFTLIYVDK